MRYKLIAILIIFIFPSKVFSYNSTDYVLPYPSVMPGNVLYKIHTIWEELQNYWYFGNFSKFKYSLKLSDKYLVEAKTLFEYDQLLLGRDSLIKSDHYFDDAVYYLDKAVKEKKDVSEKIVILDNASKKHKNVLNSIKSDLPKFFTWELQNGQKLKLMLHDIIDNSIKERNIL